MYILTLEICIHIICAIICIFTLKKYGFMKIIAYILEINLNNCNISVKNCKILEYSSTEYFFTVKYYK